MDILSCQKAIGRDCFKAYPDFARRAIAYRLLHLLIPPEMSKVLPTKLTDPLIAPGVKIPLDAKFPPGTVIIPGCDFPAGWNPKDDPPECVKSMPLPAACLGGGGCIPNPYLAPGSPATSQVNPRSSPVSEPVTIEITATADNGWINNKNTDWPTLLAITTCQNCLTPDSSWSHAVAVCMFGANYYIYRTFLPFDLPTIPAGKTLQSAKLLYTQCSYHGAGISIFEGTYGDLCICNEFKAFGSVLFGAGVSVVGSNEIEFNAAGLTFLEGCLGGDCDLMLRETDHDVTGIAPGAAEKHRVGMYYSNDSTEANRPKLSLTYV